MIVFDQLRKDDPQLRVLTLGVLCGMGVLLAGLWSVQVFSHRKYSENQISQSYRTVRIPAIPLPTTTNRGHCKRLMLMLTRALYQGPSTCACSTTS